MASLRPLHTIPLVAFLVVQFHVHTDASGLSLVSQKMRKRDSVLCVLFFWNWNPAHWPSIDLWKATSGIVGTGLWPFHFPIFFMTTFFFFSSEKKFLFMYIFTWNKSLSFFVIKNSIPCLFFLFFPSPINVTHENEWTTKANHFIEAISIHWLSFFNVIFCLWNVDHFFVVKFE